MGCGKLYGCAKVGWVWMAFTCKSLGKPFRLCTTALTLGRIKGDKLDYKGK